MGIFCEMNLFKPSNGAYEPGQIISGIIKYATDEPMEFEKITTSLKGGGYVVLTMKYANKNRRSTYRDKEVYIDMDNIIQNEKIAIAAGSYEATFNFNIPHNIPSTLNVEKHTGRYRIKCRIKYYIRIKFERPGLFAFNKHFRKEITIVSRPTPRLLREPVIYGENKKLMRLFASKNSSINIKATIFNSVIPFGGKIQLQYEVDNSSSVLIKSVETKLIEIYGFKATGLHKVETETDVLDTDIKTTSINCGDTQHTPIEINVPSDIHSLDKANIVSRLYVVRIVAQLPIPHRNVVLNIPVEIGAMEENVPGNSMQEMIEDLTYDDPPPSYWEAMGETKKDDDVESDDEENK